MLFALTVWMTVQLWAAVAKYQIQPFFTLSIAPLSIVVSGLWDQKCPNAQWTQIKSRKKTTESNGCEIDLYHNYTLCEMLTCQTDNSIVNVWWMEQREKRTHQNNQFYTSHIHKGEHPWKLFYLWYPWGAMKVQWVWVHYQLERDLANALLVAQPYSLIISFNNSGMSLHNIMDVAWDKGDRSLINLYLICSWLHGNFIGLPQRVRTLT